MADRMEKWQQTLAARRAQEQLAAERVAKEQLWLLYTEDRAEERKGVRGAKQAAKEAKLDAAPVLETAAWKAKEQKSLRARKTQEQLWAGRGASEQL